MSLRVCLVLFVMRSSNWTSAGRRELRVGDLDREVLAVDHEAHPGVQAAEMGFLPGERRPEGCQEQEDQRVAVAAAAICVQGDEEDEVVHIHDEQNLVLFVPIN